MKKNLWPLWVVAAIIAIVIFMALVDQGQIDLSNIQFNVSAMILSDKIAMTITALFGIVSLIIVVGAIIFGLIFVAI